MEEALKVYHTTKSVGKTVQKLGYPTCRQLYSWINHEGNVPVDRKQLPKVNNPTEHPRNPPAEIKLSAIQRCFELGESIQSVSEEIGYTRASIYQWRKRYLKEEGLVVRIKRRGKYSSYAGEITPEVGNILERDFHTDKPNQKWLTDITEFAIPAGKIYLSPIVDCFDGLLVTWNISTKPNAALVNTMLDHAIATLHRNEHPILHSDRGCHYRWDEWIEKMEVAGLIRSKSKKDVRQTIQPVKVYLEG